MKLRKLGKFGPDISPIGVGAMSFSNFYGATTETQSHRILHTALAQGISHIDTANVYGMGVSEATIGNFLTQNKASAAGKFTLATKAGIRRDPETGNNIFDNSAKHLAEELDKKLTAAEGRNNRPVLRSSARCKSPNRRGDANTGRLRSSWKNSLFWIFRNRAQFFEKSVRNPSCCCGSI